MIQVVINLLFIVILTVLAWQDFRSRKMTLVFVMVALILAAVAGYMHQTLFIRSVFCNLLFVSAQLLLLIGYLKLRGAQIRNFLQAYMGVGDLCFLFLSALYVGFPFFVVFLMGCYVFALVVEGIRRLLISCRNKTVPLAGYMAVGLIILIVVDQIERVNVEQWMWQWLEIGN